MDRDLPGADVIYTPTRARVPNDGAFAFNGTAHGPHGCKHDRAALQLNGPSAAPSSSTGGTHNELCLSGWHGMRYTHAFLGLC